MFGYCQKFLNLCPSNNDGFYIKTYKLCRNFQAQDMPASPIRKLVPFSDAAKKRGIKVYHLNIGQPDIATPDVAINAIRNFSQKVVEYSHSAGILSYRQKLVTYYADNNIHITTDDIIVTSGGSEAILIALSTIMDPEDELIVPNRFMPTITDFQLIVE